MVLQDEMIANHFERLARAPETGEPVVSIHCSCRATHRTDPIVRRAPVLPEINALQSGTRKLSGDYIAEAERSGHLRTCTYVTRSIGMMRQGNIAFLSTKPPRPTCCRFRTRSATPRSRFELRCEVATLG